MNYAKIQRKPRIVVEIGHGAKPVFQICRGMLEERTTYIGLDIATHPHIDMERARKAIIAVRNGRFFTLAQEVALEGELPIVSSTVDEVHMHSILDDPTIPLERRIQLFQEAARILRIGGALFLEDDAFEELYTGDREPIRSAIPSTLAHVPNSRIEELLPPADAQWIRSRVSGLESVGRGSFGMELPAMPLVYVRD